MKTVIATHILTHFFPLFQEQAHIRIVVCIHFLAVKADGASPLVATGRLLYICIELDERNLAQFKQEEELAQYKSVRGQLRVAELEQENDRLRKRLCTYEDIISRNNLWSYFSKHKDKVTAKKDTR